MIRSRSRASELWRRWHGARSVPRSGAPLEQELARDFETEAAAPGLLDAERARPFVEAFAQRNQAGFEVVFEDREADVGIETDLFAGEFVALLGDVVRKDAEEDAAR